MKIECQLGLNIHNFFNSFIGLCSRHRCNGTVQKVTFWGNTGNVNFAWFAYDSTDDHRKSVALVLNRTGISYL